MFTSMQILCTGHNCDYMYSYCVYTVEMCGAITCTNVYIREMHGVIMCTNVYTTEKYGASLTSNSDAKIHFNGGCYVLLMKWKRFQYYIQIYFMTMSSAN